MNLAQLFRFGQLPQALPGKLENRLQHGEPRLAAGTLHLPQQTLLHQ